MNYKSAVAYLNKFINYETVSAHNYGPENYNLDRVSRILKKVNNPHSKYTSIHIAGTKGKGSVAAMTESIIRASGKITGLYTSPHLYDIRERIQINGKAISKQNFSLLLETLKPYIEIEVNITYYEIITLLAFVWFAKKDVDIAILEVGLGGRLDATNVVSPILSVITTISYDHMDILGQTINQITTEKSGIIKSKTPIVTGPQTPDALSTIKYHANILQAPLIESSKLWCWKHIRQSFLIQEFSVWKKNQPDFISNYKIPLLGHHQIENSTIVLTIIEYLNNLKWNISTKNILTGFSAVKWPARCEIFSSSPPVVIDCAHNPASIISLNKLLDDMFPNKKRVIIFGAMQDKDVETMFSYLLPKSSHTILTSINTDRSMSLKKLNILADKYNNTTTIERNLDNALDIALQLSNQNDVIIATGSVPIAANIRSILTKKLHNKNVKN